MALAATDEQELGTGPVAADQRGAPRFIALIRAAKLVSEQGEFVCVVRDVSTSGVRLRCFHAIPHGQEMNLELQNGDSLGLEHVRNEGNEASFRFTGEVSIERLLRESILYPRRPLRLKIAMPLTVSTGAGPISARSENLSQQGCRVECAMPLALAQAVVIKGEGFPGVRAKVRWRRENTYGLVFDDTFSLKDFAVHAARLQCPGLIA